MRTAYVAKVLLVVLLGLLATVGATFFPKKTKVVVKEVFVPPPKLVEVIEIPVEAAPAPKPAWPWW